MTTRVRPLIFSADLVTGENIQEVVEMLRRVFYGHTVTIKEVDWKKSVMIQHFAEFATDPKTAIQYKLADDRNHPTTSHYFGFVLQNCAYHFYTGDDVVVEWLGPTVVRITNKQRPRQDEPLEHIIISIDEDDIP